MTTEIELLPLYAELQGHPKIEIIKHYAHAIAAKDAEIDTLRTRLEDTVRDSTNKIEALRAEVEKLRADRDSWEQQASDRVADWHAEHLRAEKLAAALRLIESAKDRGFGIDYARGVAQSTLRRDRWELAQENRNDRRG